MAKNDAIAKAIAADPYLRTRKSAYFASTVRLFRFSGLPVRFKRSEIIGEAAKLESQYFRCPGLQQPKPLQAGIHPI